MARANRLLTSRNENISGFGSSVSTGCHSTSKACNGSSLRMALSMPLFWFAPRVCSIVRIGSPT